MSQKTYPKFLNFSQICQIISELTISRGAKIQEFRVLKQSQKLRLW
jgi:hypothetical protein